MDDEYYITCGNFNPRSPHGERLRSLTSTDSKATFQSTLPARGATICATVRLVARREFQSTLPARGATRPVLYSEKRGGLISIHAPRTGSDSMIRIFPSSVRHFNPRSPHGERRWNRQQRMEQRYFNPRSPHGERRHIIQHSNAGDVYFNPRSPHGERRQHRYVMVSQWVEFQSTLPARGATFKNLLLFRNVEISIHAPRTGSDPPRTRRRWARCYFNPRSPHGERLLSRFLLRHSGYFNPRSPHGERPDKFCCQEGIRAYFNPRSPHGERLITQTILCSR